MNGSLFQGGRKEFLPPIFLPAKEDDNEVLYRYCSLIEEISDTIQRLTISQEVLSLNSERMIEEAQKLSKMGQNIVVKIPMTGEGLKTIKVLVSKGIKVNTPLIISLTQLLLSAKAGTTYVSPLIGRLDDVSQTGMGLVKQIAYL